MKSNKPKLKDLKAKAYEYGVKAFNTGLKSVPHYDTEFFKFIKDEVPEGRRIMMYKAWSKGWHTSNANAFEDYHSGVDAFIAKNPILVQE